LTEPLNEYPLSPNHSALALIRDAARRDPMAALQLFLDASYAAFYFRNCGESELRGQSHGDQVLRAIGVTLTVDEFGFTLNQKDGSSTRYYDDPYRSNLAYYLRNLIKVSRYRVFPTFDELPVAFDDDRIGELLSERRNYEACVLMQHILIEKRENGVYGRGPEDIYDAEESPDPISEQDVVVFSGSKEAVMEIERINHMATGDMKLLEIFKSLKNNPITKVTQILIDNLPDYNVPVLRSDVLSKCLPTKGEEQYETMKDVPPDSRFAVVRKLVRWAHDGGDVRLFMHEKHAKEVTLHTVRKESHLDYMVHTMRPPDDKGHPLQDEEHLIHLNRPHKDGTTDHHHERKKYRNAAQPVCVPLKKDHKTVLRIRITNRKKD